nr:uncharacterized abhydrolase domain-containing protein DDB_G0269086-like [Aegilops tauschii subsp. strangulata]
MEHDRAGDWDSLNVIKDHITFLRNTRRLPGEGYVQARVPPAKEISPAPEEALGEFFHTKLGTSAKNEAAQCGAFIAVRRPGAGNRFPSLSLTQSVKLWQESYFYVKNVNPAIDFVNLPSYEAGPPTEPRTNWAYMPTTLSAASAAAVARLKVMTDSEGLKASDLLTAFVERRVLALQGRPHLISRMSGHRDPCRMSTREMSAMEVARLVNEISNCKLSESQAPLSHERSTSASIIRGTEGFANTRCIDPLADLRETMEKNAREAREEQEEAERQREAAKAAQEEVDVAARAQADAAAKAQADAVTKGRADAAAKVQAEGAARGEVPQLITPLCSAPPAPEIPAPIGGAGSEQPVMERERGDATTLRTEVPQQVPTAEVQGSRPIVPPTPQDYHISRAAAFNSQVQELAKRTTNMDDSQRGNATLRHQLGEAQTALHAKEEERSKMEQEPDRLAKQLADQANKHQAELQKLKDAEEALQAEFETQRSNWVEKESALLDGYGEIEDLLDEYFPGYSATASQAVEARREERRLAGDTIVPNAPQTLVEQLLSIQACLQPAH